MGQLEGIISKFSGLEEAKKISSFIDDPSLGSSAVIKGLFASSKGFLLHSAVKNSSTRHIHLVVEDTKEAAEYMCSDLYPVFGDSVFYFPSSLSSSTKIVSIKDSSNKVQRSITLSAINGFTPESDDIVIVTYPDPVKQMIVSRKAVSERISKTSSKFFRTPGSRRWILFLNLDSLP